MATIENNSSDGLRSQEPHFNDESTIRSAQPVVPLEAVNQERRRRRLLLGGAFVIACLLGSSAALALIRLRQSAIATDATAAEEINDQQQSAQTAEPESPPVETASGSQPPVEIQAAEVAAQELSKAKKKSAKHSDQPQVQIMIRTNPAPSNGSNGQARLVGQWEEKRQRRVSRRDPQQNHYSSDLFRIREIFEGPRRNRRLNNN